MLTASVVISCEQPNEEHCLSVLSRSSGVFKFASLKAAKTSLAVYLLSVLVLSEVSEVPFSEDVSFLMNYLKYLQIRTQQE